MTIKTPSTINQTIDYWWNERFHEPPHVTMKVDSYETSIEMVKNRLGYAIVPRVFVKPEDGLYCTDLVLVNGQAITRKTWMLYRESSLQFNAVGKFVHYMKSLYANDADEVPAKPKNAKIVLEKQPLEQLAR